MQEEKKQTFTLFKLYKKLKKFLVDDIIDFFPSIREFRQMKKTIASENFILDVNKYLF